MLLNVFAKKVESKEKGGKVFFDLNWKNPKNDDYFKVKFKLEAGLPSIKESGYYLLEINANDVSLQNTKFNRKDGSTGTQTIIWISKFSSCTRNIKYEEELEEKKRALINEMFKDLNNV